MRLRWLHRDLRFHAALAGGRPVAAYVLGLAFAFGWTPCIGPVLGAILTVSATSVRVAEGILLLGIYSLGLGIPFLLSAVFTGSLMRRLRSAKRLGRVLELSVHAEDITEQYFDLEIQLRNRLALEAKLRQLLERSGNRLSDLLEVEREMTRVRGEIEQLEGRKRLWDNQVGLATLHVLLAEPAPLLAGDRGGVWQALRDAFGQAGENFVATVAVVIAATGSLVPLGAALLVAFVAVRALWRRWRRSRA